MYHQCGIGRSRKCTRTQESSYDSSTILQSIGTSSPELELHSGSNDLPPGSSSRSRWGTAISGPCAAYQKSEFIGLARADDHRSNGCHAHRGIQEHSDLLLHAPRSS